MGILDLFRLDGKTALVTGWKNSLILALAQLRKGSISGESMARMARVVIPGIPHHLTQRGVRSMRIFFSLEDRHEYLQLVRYYGKIHGLHFASYSLMDNHVHHIVIPEREDSLRRAIGEAHRLYTRRINFRMGKRGYLFQGRPFSCPLDEDHFLATLRYVERNPTRAGAVENPWDYLWSGARYHVGLAPTDSLIDVDVLGHWRFSPDEWRQQLQTDPAELPTLRKKTRTGRPCGGEGFVGRLEGITGRVLRPRRPGPRPSG